MTGDKGNVLRHNVSAEVLTVGFTSSYTLRVSKDMQCESVVPMLDQFAESQLQVLRR